MSQRLERRLAKLRELGAKGVSPYLTAGDGGLEVTRALLRAAAAAGAASVELGVPFSDPIADGPILQAAAERALRQGTTLDGVLETLRRFREESDGPAAALPVAVMSYANPLLRRGWRESCRRIAAAGGDALIVPDLSLEESAPMREAALAAGLCPILFASPGSGEERVRAAARASRGFLYVVGRFGVTGGGTRFDAATLEFLAQVRGWSELPLAVGFGIRSRADVAAATRYADLAIVGSAFVEHVHRASAGAENRPAAAAAAARAFLEQLMEGGKP